MNQRIFRFIRVDYLAIHRYIDIMCNACLQYFKGGDIRKCGEMDTNAKL